MTHKERSAKVTSFWRGNAPKAAAGNPWVELFEYQMDFVLKDDHTKSYWVGASAVLSQILAWRTMK